jgi:hypothetical protein
MKLLKITGSASGDHPVICLSRFVDGAVECPVTNDKEMKAPRTRQHPHAGSSSYVRRVRGRHGTTTFGAPKGGGVRSQYLRYETGVYYSRNIRPTPKPGSVHG